MNVDKAQGDASKVTAKGPGLETTGNIANKPTYFDIYTAGNVSLVQALTFDGLAGSDPNALCFKLTGQLFLMS